MKIRHDDAFIYRINSHEKKMSKKYRKALEPYCKKFRDAGCKLKIELYWENKKKKQRSDEALAFRTGYICKVGYTVERFDRPVYMDNTLYIEGEQICDSWPITIVKRKGLRADLMMITDFNKEECVISLNSALAVVQSMFEQTKNHPSFIRNEKH